jgi:hypothetical protein
MKKANDSFKFSVNMLREIYASEFEYKKTGLAVFSERAHKAKAELDKELDFRTGFMSVRLNTKAYSPPRRQVMPRSSYMANKGNNNGNNNKNKSRKRKRQTTLTEPGGFVNLMRNNTNKKFTNKLKESTRISREAVEEENRRERQEQADLEDAEAAAEAEEELSVPAVRRGTLRNTMLADSNNSKNNRNRQAIKASQIL